MGTQTSPQHVRCQSWVDAYLLHQANKCSHISMKKWRTSTQSSIIRRKTGRSQLGSSHPNNKRTYWKYKDRLPLSSLWTLMLTTTLTQKKPARVSPRLHRSCLLKLTEVTLMGGSNLNFLKSRSLLKRNILSITWLRTKSPWPVPYWKSNTTKW